MIKFSLPALSETLAVYRVSLDYGERHEPLLISVAPLTDFMQLTDARSREGWREATNGARPLIVEVLHITTDAAEAEALCAFQIASSLTRPHLTDSPRQDAPARGTARSAVKCVETGDTWPSSAALARELGVSGAAVSKHLNKLNPTLQGRHYVRT